MNIQEIIKQKIDLPEFIASVGDVEVHRVGSDYRCRCPIHGSENSEPLIISDNGLYHCMACGSAGTAINFLADYENITYGEALERLARELNIDLANDKDYAEEVDVEKRMQAWANKGIANVENIRKYLNEKRGFTDETIAAFELGEDKGSITIPLIDSNGRHVGLAKRQFDVSPKYLNIKNNALYDKSSFLYGFYKARRMKQNALYLVEGYMDAISGYQMGLPTVAYCSNELHKDQILFLEKRLKKDVSLILVPDNDEEGKKKVPRVRENLQKIAPKREVRVLVIPDGYKDMNDMLLGGVNVQELETEHIDLYSLKYLLNKCKTIEKEYKVVEDYFRTVKGLIKISLIAYLSKRWNVPEDTIKAYFKVSGEDSETIIKEAASINDCLLDLKSIYATGGFKTHFEQIDNCIRKVEKKQVLIVGAAAGTGKSDWAIEYAIRAICNEKLRVVFFSLEMPKGKVLERIIAKLAGCKINQVQDYLEKQGVMVEELLAKLSEYLIVFDGNRYSIDDIERRIKLVNSRSLLKGDVDVVIVDYFGYMSGTSTFEDASVSARKMKAIAKDNNVIMVMLSQLNRGSMASEEPTMQNLKSTGDLEASGDIVLLLWRPAKDPTLSLEEREKLLYVTRAKIDKARDGMFGPNVMEFTYNSDTSRLEEYY